MQRHLKLHKDQDSQDSEDQKDQKTINHKSLSSDQDRKLHHDMFPNLTSSSIDLQALIPLDTIKKRTKVKNC